MDIAASNALAALFASDPTLAWLAPKMALLGVSRLVDITGLDRIGLPVMSTIRPLAKHMSVSAGKGLTPASAAISSIMESAEGWHMENPPEPSLIGSYQRLSREGDFIDPQTVAFGFWRSDIASEELAWIATHELTANRQVYIPFELTYMDSLTPRLLQGLFSASTNGLAAGPTQEHAVVHALYELLERDTMAKWHATTPEVRQQRLVDLSMLEQADCVYVLNALKAADIEVAVWDISSHEHVYSYYCQLKDNNPFSPIPIAAGHGAHGMPHVAWLRAVLEAVQSRAAVISGIRDDIFPRYYHQMQAYTADPFPVGSYPFAQTDEVFSTDATELTQTLLAKIPGPVYQLTHTRQDIGIPVVQLFAPNLQFNRNRIT